MVITNLPNSENGRLRTDGNRAPIKHKILQNSRFQIYHGEDEVSSCKTQRRVWCLATKSSDYRSSKKSPHFEFCKGNREKSAKPSTFWSRRLSIPTKPAKPAVFGIGSQSNTNSESSNLPFSELVPNETHPIFDGSGEGAIPPVAFISQLLM